MKLIIHVWYSWNANRMSPWGILSFFLHQVISMHLSWLNPLWVPPPAALSLCLVSLLRSKHQGTIPELSPSCVLKLEFVEISFERHTEGLSRWQGTEHHLNNPRDFGGYSRKETQGKVNFLPVRALESALKGVTIYWERQYRNIAWGTFLVVQWLIIHLPMQGTQVWTLVWEDPICHGVTKPMHQQEKPLKWEAHTLQLEGSPGFPQLEKTFSEKWRLSVFKLKKKKKNSSIFRLYLLVVTNSNCFLCNSKYKDAGLLISPEGPAQGGAEKFVATNKWNAWDDAWMGPS